MVVNINTWLWTADKGLMVQVNRVEFNKRQQQFIQIQLSIIITTLKIIIKPKVWKWKKDREIVLYRFAESILEKQHAIVF